MNIENDEDFKQAMEKLNISVKTGGVSVTREPKEYLFQESLEKIKTEENKPIIEALIYLLDRV
jgi:hypothetical protein